MAHCICEILALNIKEEQGQYMKDLFAIFAPFIFSFGLFVPLKVLALPMPSIVDANLWILSHEADQYRLEHSTFDPALRGVVSEAWDYQKEYRYSTFNPVFRGGVSEAWDYQKVERQSTFNPDYQGTTSDQLDENRLERSSFNPEYQGVDSPYEINPYDERDLRIIRNNFLGRARTTRPQLPSIRTDFSTSR